MPGTTRYKTPLLQVTAAASRSGSKQNEPVVAALGGNRHTSAAAGGSLKIWRYASAWKW